MRESRFVKTDGRKDGRTDRRTDRQTDRQTAWLLLYPVLSEEEAHGTKRESPQEEGSQRRLVDEQRERGQQKEKGLK